MFSKSLFTAGMVTLSLLIGSMSTPAQATDLPPSLQQEIKILQATWATSPVLIEAVKEQNAKNISLSAIKKLDDSWRSTSGLGEFMLPYLDNPAVEELARLEEVSGYVQESFVMDNQGALGGSTTKTSDFWQGDEAKFTE